MSKHKKIFIAFMSFCILFASINIFAFHENDDVSDVDYIRSNINSEYINNQTSESYVADLLVKNLYITKELALDCDGLLDNYFDKVHNEGELNGYLVTSVSSVPLYNFDDDSAYVVGMMDTDKENKILDVAFAENNDDGIELTGEIFDSDSGLVYVKKCDLYKLIDGNLYTDYVQAQTLRGVDIDDKSGIDVSINDNNYIEQSHIEEEIVKPNVVIPVENIDSKSEIEVYVNGYDTPLQSNQYEIVDDNLIIDTSAANISKVDIDLNNSVTDRAVGAFKKAYGISTAYGLSTYDSAITDEFGVISGELNVGDYVSFSATGTNAWSAKGINYVQTVAGSARNHNDFYDALIYKDGDLANDYVTGTYGGGYQNVYKSTYNACYGIKMGSSYIYDYSSDTLRDFISEINDEIQMGCIEVKKASFKDMAYDSWLDYRVVVSAVGDNYVALSFCSVQKTSIGQSNQVMCGTYAVKYEPYPPKNSHNSESVWSEYGVSSTFLNDNTEDMTIKHIQPAIHYKYTFIGYFSEGGEQITDSNGDVLEKYVPGIIKDGAFINTGPINLYAKFS